VPVGDQGEFQHAIRLAGQMRGGRGAAPRGRRWRPGGFGFYDELVNQDWHETARSSVLKKSSKKLLRTGLSLSGQVRPKLAKVFWFFSSEKNVFLIID
jgi:hypothetical protein